MLVYGWTLNQIAIAYARYKYVEKEELTPTVKNMLRLREWWVKRYDYDPSESIFDGTKTEKDFDFCVKLIPEIIDAATYSI